MEMSYGAHSLAWAPPENAKSLVSADRGDTMILAEGLWLSARLVTPARSRGITPMAGEPHHRGLCPACSCHTDQASAPLETGGGAATQSTLQITDQLTPPTPL